MINIKEIVKKSGSSSLKGRIRLAFSINVLLIFFVVTAIVFNFYIYQKTQLIELQLKRAREASSEINLYIDEVFTFVRYLSKIENLIVLNKSEKDKLFKGLLAINSAFDNFWIYRNEKVDYYYSKNESTYQDFIPHKIKNRMIINSKNDSSFSSKVNYDIRNNRYMYISAPLRNNNQIEGFIAAKVNFKFIDFYVNKMDVGLDGYVYIVDRNNNILSYKNCNKDIVLTESDLKTLAFNLINSGNNYQTYTGLFGRSSIGAAEIIRASRWTLIAELPVSEAYQPLYRVIQISVIALVIIMMISLILVFAISDRVTSPLQSLVDASKQISDGNFQVFLDVDKEDEFGLLKKSFNNMAQKISTTINDLEESRKKYKYIFDNVGVALFEEDYSAVYKKFQKLKKDGVESIENLLESNPSLVRELSSKIIIRDVNNQALKLYNANSKENLIDSLDNIFSDNSLSNFKEQLYALYRGDTFYSAESINKTIAGSEIDVLLSVFFPQDVAESERVLVSITDISGQKRVEKYLSEEREKFAVTLRSIADGVIATDIYGNIILINLEAEKITGYSRLNTIGKKIYKLLDIYSENGEESETLWERVKNNQTKTTDLLLKDKNGNVKNISEASSLIKDENGIIIGYVFVLRDITDQVRIEDETRNLQKLESIGILAGGIAHDFNNLLTAIMGNITLAKMSMDDDPEILSMLSDAEKASRRAQTLTHQLLTFSKGGKPVQDNIDINIILQESISFVLTGANVKFEFESNNDVGLIYADAGQLNQVFNNLLINAKQSMSEGGTIYIKTEKYTNDNSFIHLKDKEYVKVTVRDEGDGICEKIIDKVFDPFFTTKESGSGLGLATSFSIVRQHQGTMVASNCEEGGAVFEVYLPIGKVKKTVNIIDKNEPFVPAKGKILVMDDEEIVRKVIVKMLEELGYEPTAVSNGIDAYEIYRNAFEQGIKFDAVILDLTIPGGYGGAEVLKDLLKIDPDIKAVVASGYSNNRVMSKYEEFHFKGIIQKPFSIDNIASVLSKIIINKEV